MRKTASVLALTLALGIGTPAKPHPHHQEALQGKVGNASDTDLWRHSLLHVAAASPTTIPEGVDDTRLTIINTAKRFRAEFEKAIDDFNAAQETRVEADQIAALKGFIAQRDAMVEAYKNELLSATEPQRWTAFEQEVLRKMPVKSIMKSSGAAPATEENCGIPNSITCSITYSIAQRSAGLPDTVNDTFGRANGAPGSNWTAVSGTFAITSDALTVTSNGSPAATMYYSGQTFSNDQTVQAMLASLPASGDYIGITVRQSAFGETNYYAVVSYNGSAYSLQVGKIVAGVTTTKYAGNYAAAVGDRITLTVDGTFINAYLNGSPIYGFSDSSITSGSPGVMGTVGGGSLKNFFAGSAGAVVTMNQILDGAATMPGNSQHARHTPTVTMTIDGTPHNNSGKTVCTNCYLYVNADVSTDLLSGAGAQPKGFTLEGSVVCSEAGKFYDVRPGSE
jgi:hypothetical protein